MVLTSDTISIKVTMSIYTASQKNDPPLACNNFDTHEWILTFFGRYVTNKVGNQKTLYYATWSNLCFCTTSQNGETWKSHFHSVGLCYTHNAPVRCLPERKSCHLWCVWVSNVCWGTIVRCPIKNCQLTFTPGLTKNNSHLLHNVWHRDRLG